MDAHLLYQMKHSKSSKARRMANEIIENIKGYREDLEAAKAAGYSDIRVPLAEKLEKDPDAHIIEQHISKRGELITLVGFKGGHKRQYTGALDENYESWNY